MLTPSAVANIRVHWPDVVVELEKELGRIHAALVAAENIETIRMLQGQAKAMKKMITLPEALAMLIEEEEVPYARPQ